MNRHDLFYLVGIANLGSALILDGLSFRRNSGLVKTSVTINEIPYVARLPVRKLPDNVEAFIEHVKATFSTLGAAVFDVKVEQKGVLADINGACPICDVVTVKYTWLEHGRSRISMAAIKDRLSDAILKEHISWYNDRVEQVMVEHNLRPLSWTIATIPGQTDVSGPFPTGACVTIDMIRPAPEAAIPPIGIAIDVVVVWDRKTEDGLYTIELDQYAVDVDNSNCHRPGVQSRGLTPVETTSWLSTAMPDIVVGCLNGNRLKSLLPSNSTAIVCDIGLYLNASADKRVRQPTVDGILTTFGGEPQAEITKRIWHAFNAIGIFDTAVAMTKLTGALLSNTLQRSDMKTVDMMLMHIYNSNGMLIPSNHDKLEDVAENEGGLVFTPSTADSLLGHVSFCDFRSHYPAIAIAYNMCFSRPKGDWKPLTTGEHRTLLADALFDMLNQREAIKKELKDCKDQDRAKKLDTRQRALKIAMNAMYGITTCKYSHFYRADVGELIARYGRMYLEIAAEEVKKAGLELLTGDTDSIFFLDATGSSELQRQICERINARAIPPITIVPDGSYSEMFCHKKKGYAALTPSGSVVVKGLGCVRRDKCEIACRAGRLIIEAVLRHQPRASIVALITSAKEQIVNCKNTRDLMAVTILRRPIESYKSKPPHIQAAVSRRSNHKWEIGDPVSWCAFIDPTTNARKYLLESDTEHEIDRSYYLDQLESMLEQIPLNDPQLPDSGLPPIDIRYLLYGTRAVATIPEASKREMPSQATKVEDIIELLKGDDETDTPGALKQGQLALWNDVLVPTGISILCTQCKYQWDLENLLKRPTLSCDNCKKVLSVEDLQIQLLMLKETVSRETFNACAAVCTIYNTYSTQYLGLLCFLDDLTS